MVKSMTLPKKAKRLSIFFKCPSSEPHFVNTFHIIIKACSLSRQYFNVKFNCKTKVCFC